MKVKHIFRYKKIILIISSFVRAVARRILRLIVVSRSDAVEEKDISVNELRGSYVMLPKYTVRQNLAEEFDSDNYCDRFSVSPFNIYHAENISLIGSYAIPFTSHGKIIEETTLGNTEKCVERTVRKLGIIKYFIFYVNSFLFRKEYDVDSALHLVPRHGYGADNPNYCHWVLENLPQLYAMNLLPVNTKIIINKTPKTWQLQSLSLMGFSNVFLHEMDVTRVKHMYYVTMRSASSVNSERDPVGRKWAIDRIINASSLLCIEHPRKRLFLSRQGMERGHISNIDELQELFDKYNIEIFVSSGSSFQEDVCHYHDVQLIIAPHGAALSNMVFSKNATVIEIVAGSKSDADFFRHTAHEFGLTYDKLHADVDVNCHSQYADVCEAWTVDVNVLEKMIVDCIEYK